MPRHPRALRSALAVLLLRAAAGTGSQAPRVPRAAVLSALAAPPLSAAADPAFECAWRSLALEYAQQLQPFRPAAAFADIFAGLELGARCNQTYVAPPAAAAAAATRP